MCQFQIILHLFSLFWLSLFRFGDLFVIAQIDNFINCIQLLGILNWVFSQCFAPVFCLLLIAFAVTVSFIIVSVDIAVSVARPLWTRQSINELLKLYICYFFLFNSYWIVLRSSLPVPRVPRHLSESNVYVTLMFRYRCSPVFLPPRTTLLKLFHVKLTQIFIKLIALVRAALNNAC